MSTNTFAISPPHWVFGNTADMRRAPHLFPAALAERSGGLARYRILNRPFVAICDAELAHHVLVTGRARYGKAFQHRNLGILIGNGLFGSDGEVWQKARRQLQPSFQPNAIKRIVAPVARSFETLFAQEWQAPDGTALELSVTQAMQRLTLLAMGRMLFSTDFGAQESARIGAQVRAGFLHLRARNLSLFQMPLWWPTPNNRKLLACKRFLDQVVGTRVSARLRSPQPDLPDMLNFLIEARDPETGDALTEADLVDQSKSLLLAGYETTAVSLSWTLYLIARHPEIAARLAHEVDEVLGGRVPTWEDLPRLAYASQVIHESLRLYPPVYSTARECLEDDVVGGHPVRKGSVVIISIYGVHRAPEWGETPEAFRPERFAGKDWPRRSFLPYSSGRHVCLGSSFAMVEMVLAVAMIMQRFRVSAPDSRPIEPKAVVTLIPSRDIRLQFTPR